MKLFVFDEFGPQDIAMMQALYSRDAQSVEVHAEKVRKMGSGKFMASFYVGYGHDSIGDCGSTTIFVEGVSMLVAKAVQDWPLYSGQETSTRYIDMVHQKIVDPIGTDLSHSILEKWMAFYRDNQSAVNAHLRNKYPKKDDEDEVVYGKAIKARVFDIMRGFLPAGITTQLSWHTNLRQAHDKLSLLIYHPLAEVQQAALGILANLKGKYPESFSHKLYPEQEKYRENLMKYYTYYDEKMYAGDFTGKTSVQRMVLEQYERALTDRPQKTNLPLFLEELGSVTFEFLLDFGSFRDIQRHRNGVCRMPILNTDLGFNDWYLEELPDDIREKAKWLICAQTRDIANLKATPEIEQYYVAMGFNVSCQTTYGLPAAVYVMELRSSKTVHPTLRKVAHKMYHFLHNSFPMLALHADLGPDDWTIRRGMHDIQEKK
jgi:thymidylate synthase ThyX